MLGRRIKSIFCFSNLPRTNFTSPVLDLEEGNRLEFIERFLSWMRGSNVLETQSCMIFNFGWYHHLPYPHMMLTEDTTVTERLFWRTGPFRSPNSCSIVLIGSKYLDKLSEGMAVVDGVSEYMQMMPFAIFLETENG